MNSLKINNLPPLEVILSALPEDAIFYNLDFVYQFKTQQFNSKNFDEIRRHIERQLITKFNPFKELKVEDQLLNTHYRFEFSFAEFNLDLSVQKFIYVKVFHIDNEVRVREENQKLYMHQINNSKNAELAEISAGIGHEINNPLTIICAKTQYLKNQIQSSEIENKNKILESLDKIETHSERITRIVRSLKNFSRISENDVFESVLLSQIFQDSLSMVIPRIKEKGIQAVYDLKAMNIYIMCIPSEIVQIMLNLLKNSIDVLASHRIPMIKIEVVQFTVSKLKVMFIDNGAGILPENVDKIFNSFYTTKPSGLGTGLGLSISKHLAIKNNGDLYLDQNSDMTCFCLELVISKQGDAK